MPASFVPLTNSVVFVHAHVCMWARMCVWCLATAAKSLPLYPTLCDHMDSPTGLLCLWDFPGKNTGVSCHFPLHGVFSTQGLNSCLLWLSHCKQILFHWATREVNSIMMNNDWWWIPNPDKCYFFTWIETLKTKYLLRMICSPKSPSYPLLHSEITL